MSEITERTMACFYDPATEPVVVKPKKNRKPRRSRAWQPIEMLVDERPADRRPPSPWAGQPWRT